MQVKNSSVWLLLLFQLFGAAHAQPARLVVPAFAEDVQPVEEKIFLPAFRLELTKRWPEDLQPYSLLVAGSQNTAIYLQQKGTVTKVRLAHALKKKQVAMFAISATADGRNPGLLIESTGPHKIVRLKTAGFISAAANDPSLSIDTSFLPTLNRDYFLNTSHGPTYGANQRHVWQAVNRSLVKNPAAYDSLLQAYAGYLRNAKRSAPFYSIQKRGNQILVHAADVPADPATKEPRLYNDDGMHYFMMADILAEVSPKLLDDKTAFKTELFFASDSTLDSLVAEGNFLGTLPVRLRYTTAQKIKMVATFLENTPIERTGAIYPLRFFVVYNLGANEALCGFSPPQKLTLSSTDAQFAAKGCGIEGKAAYENIIIGL